MSSSSSSYGSGDDLADASEFDVAADSNGFGGWGLEDISFEGLAPSGNLMIKAKEEPWPVLDDVNKKETKKKKRIPIGNEEDDEALYDAIVESEQEEEEDISTTNIPPPAVPCEKDEEFETEDEDDEEDEEVPSQYQPVPGPAPVVLPPPLTLEESGSDSESEFETEEIENVPAVATTKVEPVPETVAPAPPATVVESKEMQKTLETAKDVQEILEKNLNEKNKVVDSAKDAEELKKLREALKEFHQYAATPNEKRAVSFKNNIFNAKSKDITVSHEKRLFLALKCLEKMTALSSIGAKEDEKVRVERTTQSVPIDGLMSQLSHAFCSFISSQENVPSATRKALTLTLMADVTNSSLETNSVAKTTLVLASTIGNMLLSEASSLKTASLVTSSQEKRKMFEELRSKIVVDVEKFVDAISVAVPSEAATKKILQQISIVSKKFSTAALTFSSNEFGKSGDSYATSLSKLLCQFAKYASSATEYNANQDFASVLIFQANMLMPDLIMHHEATYDVLASMLDGLKGTFNVIESPQERKKIISAWKQIKTDLSDRTNYLTAIPRSTTAIATETKTSQPPTTTTKLVPKQQSPPATTKPTEKKQSSQEEHFISRFSHISDDED